MQETNRVMGIFKKHWPLLAGLIILWGTIGWLAIASIQQNQGHLIYVLDDPYIHMAIAKNFAEHGVWGVTKYNFSSSSSSIIWTLILSLVYFVSGIHDATPFVLDVVLGSLTLVAFYALISNFRVSRLGAFLSILALIFVTPIPYLVFTGQEHILHILITVFTAYTAAQVLTREETKSSEYFMLLLAGILLTLSRYEGLFLLFVIVVLFLLRKRYYQGLLLGFCGILPILVFGAISVLHGWYLLPDSVLLKGNLPNFSLDRFLGYKRILFSPYILMLILVASTLYILRSRSKTAEGFWDRINVITLIFVATTFLHVQFAEMNLRYDAYLVALGLFATTIAAADYLRANVSFKFSGLLLHERLFLAVLLFFFIFPLFNRAVLCLNITNQSSRNIYQQQYQMGLFVREFYQNNGVAVNDIGAVNYLADIRCLDLWGLSTPEVARARIADNFSENPIFDRLPFLRKMVGEGFFTYRGYSKDQIGRLADQKDVKVAIVYDDWFVEFGGLPEQWIKVGEWAIRDNIAAGGDYVSIYAVDSSEVDRLEQNLRAFASKLPEDVIQSGRYWGSDAAHEQAESHTNTDLSRKTDDDRSHRDTVSRRRIYGE